MKRKLYIDEWLGLPAGSFDKWVEEQKAKERATRKTKEERIKNGRKSSKSPNT